MNLTIVCVVLAFVVALLAQEFMHYKERKDLYNRIMAKDLAEYKAADGAPPKGRNGLKKGIEDAIRRKAGG